MPVVSHASSDPRGFFLRLAAACSTNTHTHTHTPSNAMSTQSICLLASSGIMQSFDRAAPRSPSKANLVPADCDRTKSDTVLCAGVSILGSRLEELADMLTSAWGGAGNGRGGHGSRCADATQAACSYLLSAKRAFAATRWRWQTTAGRACVRACA